MDNMQILMQMQFCPGFCGQYQVRKVPTDNNMSTLCTFDNDKVHAIEKDIP